MSEYQEDAPVDSKIIRKQQLLKIAYGLVALAISVFTYDFVVDYFNPPPVPKKERSEKISVELATEGLDGGKIWFNNLDQRLEKEVLERVKQENKQAELIGDLEGKLKLQQEANSELDVMKQQISWLKKELEEDKKASRLGTLPAPKQQAYAETTGQKIGSENGTMESQLKDSSNYIPAGSFVSGILRGGISASTGVGASAEPSPIFIRVTGRGDLPSGFKVDLTKCRIVASGYGAMANERIVARAETLSCTDENKGKVIETQVVGTVHSSDSKNGIKGTVVSMAGKHLKNAAIGGVISGLAGSNKGNEGMMFNPALGAISTKKAGMQERLSDGLGQGTISAAEKLADYHMKLAEATAPVVEVPGAVPVTVFFSKGVYLGSGNVKEEVKRARQ